MRDGRAEQQLHKTTGRGAGAAQAQQIHQEQDQRVGLHATHLLHAELTSGVEPGGITG